MTDREVHRIDDVRVWLDPGGGVTIHASTSHGDPVELTARQARTLADCLRQLADADENE